MYDGPYLKTSECKPGWLYRIHARNGNFGICEVAPTPNREMRFRLSRHKFGANYIYPEIHWDCDDHYGTVKPVEALEEAPKFADESEELAYLNRWEKRLLDAELKKRPPDAELKKRPPDAAQGVAT